MYENHMINMCAIPDQGCHKCGTELGICRGKAGFMCVTKKPLTVLVMKLGIVMKWWWLVHRSLTMITKKLQPLMAIRTSLF